MDILFADRLGLEPDGALEVLRRFLDVVGDAALLGD